MDKHYPKLAHMRSQCSKSIIILDVEAHIGCVGSRSFALNQQREDDTFFNSELLYGHQNMITGLRRNIYLAAENIFFCVWAIKGFNENWSCICTSIGCLSQNMTMHLE